MVQRLNEPIATWSEGDRVTGFALLTRREERQDRNGNSYLDLDLCDASGALNAKAWSESPARGLRLEPPAFVAFAGTVVRYKDRLQLNLERCRLATEEDRSRGFDEARLVPTTPEDIETLWERLRHLLDAIRHPALARLAASTLETHGEALRLHPAAKRIHHAYRGGLLEHVVSLLELGEAVAAHYPEVDADLLKVGILFHDLGKLQELGELPGSDYTTRGRLVGHVVLGRDLLRQRCAALGDFPDDLRLQLEHLILSHQGRKEFGSPVEPMTATALVLHYLDDLDAKLNQIRDAPAGGPFVYLRTLGRSIYRGAATDEAPTPAGNGEAEASEPLVPDPATSPDR